MTDNPEWPMGARFGLGAVVGAGLGFLGTWSASLSMPWEAIVVVASGLLFGLLGVALGKQMLNLL